MNYVVISFYQYQNIATPCLVVDNLRKYCEKNEILGRILVAREGINGAVSGISRNIELFKTHVRKIFPGLSFRGEKVEKASYHKLVVRERKEIVAFNHPVSLAQAAPYIEPEELHLLYENKEEFQILDVRNDYETSVGTFEKAVQLHIQHFREFPEAVNNLDKSKPIITFCTGGVRCEKASAYMREQGFSNVKQLHGGIIAYTNKFPNKHFKGANFVFDDRLVSDKNKAEPITVCTYCNVPSKRYSNCFNLDCDKLFISCTDCQTKTNGSCSELCMKSPRRRKKIIKSIIVGKVLNYYPKQKVAYAKILESVHLGMEVTIRGKTTDMKMIISELRLYDNSTVTFPVSTVVRENDVLCIELYP